MVVKIKVNTVIILLLLAFNAYSFNNFNKICLIDWKDVPVEKDWPPLAPVMNDENWFYSIGHLFFSFNNDRIVVMHFRSVKGSFLVRDCAIDSIFEFGTNGKLKHKFDLRQHEIFGDDTRLIDYKILKDRIVLLTINSERNDSCLLMIELTGNNVEVKNQLYFADNLPNAKKTTLFLRHDFRLGSYEGKIRIQRYNISKRADGKTNHIFEYFDTNKNGLKKIVARKTIIKPFGKETLANNKLVVYNEIYNGDNSNRASLQVLEDKFTFGACNTSLELYIIDSLKQRESEFFLIPRVEYKGRNFRFSLAGNIYYNEDDSSIYIFKPANEGVEVYKYKCR